MRMCFWKGKFLRYGHCITELRREPGEGGTEEGQTPKGCCDIITVIKDGKRTTKIIQFRY
jgi:hypothetical protein